MPDTPSHTFRAVRPDLAPLVLSRALPLVRSLVLSLLLLSACAVASVPVGPPMAEPTADAAPATTTELPPVPAVRGPISIRVQHPADGTLLGVDSTFVFGTVGTGDATLRINGAPVPVADNGAFLAYLAVPSGPSPVFALEVARDVRTPTAADSSRGTVRIRRPTRTALPAAGVLRVDSASVSPRGAMRWRADELVRVSVRAPFNATAWLRTSDARTVPLVRVSDIAETTAQAAGRGPSDMSLDRFGVGDMDSLADASTVFVGEARAEQLGNDARLIVARAADTVQLALGTPDIITPTAPARYGVLRNRTGGLVAQSDTDKVVTARPVPDGFYKWALLPGTQLEITGQQGNQTRVRMDSQLETWVTTDDIVPLPDGTPAVRRVSGGLRVQPDSDYVDVIIPTGSRPAFLVEPDDASIVLTLYDTRLSPEISPLIGNDPLVRQLAWEPVASDRTRLEVRLSAPVYGWLVLWDDARRALVLRVRRIPQINESRPLAGLTLVVDAGHPPGGATGPTGLTEADAVLPVAKLLQAMLERRGAQVAMTRTTPSSVGLTDRPVIARRANAHAFLSVHLNAFGDGTNPFTNHGTSTLFFHQPSEPLARAVQREMMQQIGQRDIGIHYQNLAIARPTWYPSALAEGLFLMFPDQEAAMRREDWQQRYARAIADGAENYFRSLGARAQSLSTTP